MVGRGMKPSLANLQASKDVKDILVMCWTFKPEARPDFSILHNYLEKIPSKLRIRLFVQMIFTFPLDIKAGVCVVCV